VTTRGRDCNESLRKRDSEWGDECGKLERRAMAPSRSSKTGGERKDLRRKRTTGLMGVAEIFPTWRTDQSRGKGSLRIRGTHTRSPEVKKGNFGKKKGEQKL